MDGLSVAASVVALLGTATAIIQAIQKAKASVRGASNTLDKVSEELVTTQQTVDLVKAEPSLQTQGVGEALDSLIKKQEKLLVFLDALVQIQNRRKVERFFRALKDGDRDDRQLRLIMGDMGAARDNLSLHIQLTHVGLTRHQNDGFQVAYDLLMEVDMNVRETLGSGLRMARVLEARPLPPRDDSGLTQLTDDDIRLVQEELPATATADTTPRFHTRNLRAGDGFAMFEGDLGFDSPATGTSQLHSSIDDVRLGENARIHRGHVSNTTAKDFLAAFYGGKGNAT